ncbi:MAG: glycosyltransferase family 4 protein [Aristaeellaceae bacterium]
MKVLYIGGDVLPTGASFSMAKLIEEEEKLGIEVVPVVHKGNTHRLLNEGGKRHYVVNAWSWMVSKDASSFRVFLLRIVKGALNIPCYFQYRRIIRREAPDLVHVNALTTYTGSQAAIHAAKPLVWHIREMMEEDLNGRFWSRRQAHRLMKKADCFIAISSCVEKKYREIVGQQRIRCIYNGVDRDLFYRADHTILAQRRIVLTMAGRITREKGQAQCLEALAPLLREEPDLVLCFAGDGNADAIAELTGIRDRCGLTAAQVRLLGFVEEMDRLWSRTDIAIVYSKFEAFGRVTVEAKMAGALVIGFDSGGTSELIEDGVDGYLFDGKTRTLYDAVKMSLSNREASRRIADRGREMAAQVFTSENNARQVHRLYREILKER